MSNHILRWKAKKKRAVERRPWIRIDDVTVEKEDKHNYQVTILGHNLHGVISPPRVTMGGVKVRNLRFSDDGRTLRGTLEERPKHLKVIVDYGFTKGGFG
jgi:hypothetical protein